ncbi:MAG: PolC-type DNA polymerase III [Christensenellales bacterium]|jgi:DNA polymerase-3 subunit alpha (Gram-positive type)
MSMLWKELLRDMDPAVHEALTLDRVVTNRAANKLTVKLLSTRLLSEFEFVRIQNALQKGFPKAELELNVSYPALREEVLSDMDKTMRHISLVLMREKPGVMPYLLWEDASWKLDGEKLTVGVSDEIGLKYMQRNEVDARIERLMQELFHISCRVVLEIKGDTEKCIARIEKGRIEEEERLARLAQEKAEVSRKAAKTFAQSGRIWGKPITGESIPLSDLTEEVGRVVVKGEVTKVNFVDMKNGDGKIAEFCLSDATGSVPCKAFLTSKKTGNSRSALEAAIAAAMDGIAVGKWVCVQGIYQFDDYKKEMILLAQSIERAKKPEREDTAEEKRVELHLHTNMSAMDAVAPVEDLIAQAAKWGHRAIAVTDHGVVQAFPEAFAAAKKKGIKLIPGCEGYLIDDRCSIVKGADERLLCETAFVVVDFETTGLNTERDEIIEIGAVRFERGEEVAQMSQLIDPMRPIPEKVTEITGITDAMVRDMPRMRDMVQKLYDFCKGAVVCAHNADFDMRFLRRAFRDAGLEVAFPILDTLALSRCVLPGQKSHKLGAVCKALGVSLKDAHRAVHDARATAQCLMEMLKMQDGIACLDQLNTALTDDGGSSTHVILLAKTQKGIENLYRLVSEAHLNHFYRTPRIPRSLLEAHREGLIVGSACESGELFRAVVEGEPLEKLQEIASFYDYLEIQPIGNNRFMVRNGTAADDEALRDYNRCIVEVGSSLGKPVVATGDVHFLDPHDDIFRAILLTVKGYEDAQEQAPLYFKTTDEMLEEFIYLGAEKCREVVITAPNAIADEIEEGLSVFIRHPEGKETFQPYWEEADDDVRTLTEETARRIYGDPLPDIVRARLDKELSAIIGYGFSTLYDIAVKLVQKSVSDGYIVGSRGSVGSSLVAYMTGITEVNALPPHYVCPNCKHSEFDVPKEYACGIDLPHKNCPQCGAAMNRDGFNIPFEVFLGFKGDKVPDIDLNFSGEYQARAQNYVKELFGAENVFRAGTVGSVQDKIAYGYVKKYLEETGKSVPAAEKERLARGITGVKTTTGQHPAGMVVLPKNYEIYQFTPVQRPANDTNSDIITTHFAFKSMHDVLVKLDILGHDDPTMLRRLQDLTGIAPQEVPLDDPEVFRNILSLFRSPKVLGVTAEDIACPTGTLGIPEFGTPFVIQMLVETKPASMEELIRISGLSHGTNVWAGNVQDIVKAGLAPLRQCICTRDDIMNQLIDMGCESKMAFSIMESVRKGKGLTLKMEAAMLGCDTPEYVIDCCKKIGYMFPKSHAVAYVMMALRIAYFKVYYPKEYYACYFRRNIDAFDASRMVAPIETIRARIEEIREMEKDEQDKKADEAGLLDVIREMLARGIELLPISLYESDAEAFLIKDGRILPPFSALPGLGLSAAQNLVAIRDGGRFLSKGDMLTRKVTRSVIDMLESVGALEGMPETSQVSLFEGLS